MKTRIYYHSATGNSLLIARRIAAELGNAEVTPMSGFTHAAARPASREAVGNRAAPLASPGAAGNGAAQRVGFIFPVIAWGPPRSVREFIACFDPTGVEYAFAVASCGGTPANSLPLVAKLLRKRGGRLHAGFAVRSASYMQTGGKDTLTGIVNMVRSLSGRVPGAEAERLPAVIEAIKGLKASRPERSAFIGALVGSAMNGMAASQMAKQDSLYRVTSACDGCGICTRLCPRDNIGMADNTPIWKHDCESCGACRTWCPRNAIAIGPGDPAPAGHNPGVSLKDMILRK